MDLFFPQNKRWKNCTTTIYFLSAQNDEEPMKTRVFCLLTTVFFSFQNKIDLNSCCYVGMHIHTYFNPIVFFGFGNV